MISKEVSKEFDKNYKKASKALQRYITNFGIQVRIMSRDSSEEYFWLSGKCDIGYFEFDFIKIDKTRYKGKAFKLWFGALVEMKEVKEP